MEELTNNKLPTFFFLIYDTFSPLKRHQILSIAGVHCYMGSPRDLLLPSKRNHNIISSIQGWASSSPRYGIWLINPPLGRNTSSSCSSSPSIIPPKDQINRQLHREPFIQSHSGSACTHSLNVLNNLSSIMLSSGGWPWPPKEEDCAYPSLSGRVSKEMYLCPTTLDILSFLIFYEQFLMVPHGLPRSSASPLMADFEEETHR